MKLTRYFAAAVVLISSWSLFGCLALCSAQPFSQSLRVSPAGNTGAHAPYLVVERDGSLDVSWFQSNADIWFSRSIDHGASWSAATRVSKQVTTNAYTSLLQRTPHFAADSKGTLHMTWTEDRVNKQSDVFYTTSTDHGTTWSPAVSIMDANDSQKYAQDFSSLAIDSNDNIYIAYLDNRELVRGTWTNYQLYVEKSSNGGVSWGAPTKATNMPGNKGGTCECCTLEIVAGKTGHVYIAFRSNIENRRDIWIARSRDGAKTFDQAILAQQGVWTLPACPTTGPSIVLDAEENAIVSWRDSRQSIGRDLCYTTVLPYGDTDCLPNKVISRTSNQSANWPSIGRNADNGLAVVYQANSSGTNQLRYTLSYDGGNTWSTDLPVDGGTSDQEEAIAKVDAAGVVHVVWQDARNGSNGIYYSNCTLKPAIRLGAPTLSAPNGPIVSTGAPIGFAVTPPMQVVGAPFLWYDFEISGADYYAVRGSRIPTFAYAFTKAGMYTAKVVMHSLLGADSATGQFTVVIAGVEEHSSAAALRIYPNPSDGRNISIVGIPSGNARIVRVFDELGRECYVQPLGSEDLAPTGVTLSLSALAAGSYLVSIEDGNGRRLESTRLLLK